MFIKREIKQTTRKIPKARTIVDAEVRNFMPENIVMERKMRISMPTPISNPVIAILLGKPTRANSPNGKRIRKKIAKIIVNMTSMGYVANDTK